MAGGRIGRGLGRRIGLASGSAALPEAKPRQCSTRPLRASARRGPSRLIDPAARLGRLRDRGAEPAPGGELLQARRGCAAHLLGGARGLRSGALPQVRVECRGRNLRCGHRRVRASAALCGGLMRRRVESPLARRGGFLRCSVKLAQRGDSGGRQSSHTVPRIGSHYRRWCR